MIDPTVDNFIRSVHAELAKQGYRASYSKALNITLTVGVYSILADKSMSKEALEHFAQIVIETWKKLSE